MVEKPGQGYILPGRIFGNLYFVGTYAASVHLIDTGDGLIAIDAGYPETLYLVIHNIHELGFSPKDIKIILLSHGHYDHMGAARMLASLSGAKIYLGRPDLCMVNGETEDIDWALIGVCNGVYTGKHVADHIRFTPDVLLDDGDTVTLGNTTIRCVSTPGHTAGTLSFFFPVTDDETTYLAGMHGGAGTNTMTDEFLAQYGLTTSVRDDFRAGLMRVIDEPVDIFVGNHTWNNDTKGKLEALRRGEPNRFIDPTAWRAFIESRLQALAEVEAKSALH